MKAPLPSNRSFGRLFVIVFALLGGYGAWLGKPIAWWFFGAAGITAAVTLFKPSWLTPLNRAWMGLAVILHRIVSPVVLGIMFFGLLTPVGVVRRWFGWDPLRLRFEADTTSYWIHRTPPGPSPDSLSDQF